MDRRWSWKMTKERSALGAALAATLALPAGAARAADTPPLVQAYVSQLAQQCAGGLSPAAALGLANRIDLNGDKLEDWVVDGSRYSCPTRAKDFARSGALVTVFLGRADGRALPAFQRAAHGANLERRPDGRYVLSVTVAGGDCGVADTAIRCSRQLVWLPNQGQFTLAEPSLAGGAPR